MPLVRITPKPGINTLMTQTQNSDGWSFSNLIRWRMGLPEKFGGWIRFLDTVCAGFIRRMHAWDDLSDDKNLLVGTDGGLQIVVNHTLFDMTLINISAGGGSGADLANFSVTIGSANVTVGVPVDFTSIQVGSFVTFALPVSIGGRILAVGSSFAITAVAVGSFHFTMTSNAIYSEANAPGIPLFSPIAIDTGGLVTTVTFRRHGKSAGQTFHVDQTTTLLDAFVGGASDGSTRTFSIPAGTDITVATVPSVDTFTFDASTYITDGEFIEANDGYEGTQQTSMSTTFGIVMTFGSTDVAIDPALQTWYLHNQGENGLIVYTHSGLYVYQPPVGTAPSATLVGNDTNPPTAPQTNHGMIVAMPQEQVILWGTEPVLGDGVNDPLLLRWSDAGTYDTWSATVSNQAGSYRLSKGSSIIGAVQAPQTTLVFTDTDVWSMSYQGPPLIYGFTVMGSGCGLLAPHAVGVIGRNTYWLSLNGIWSFGEQGVRPVPCPLWDTIFRDIDMDSISLAHVGVNSGFNEVTFWYPSLQDAPTPLTNLLGDSQTFSHTSWDLTGASITNSFVAPDTTATASKLTEDSTTGFHACGQLLAKDRSSITMTFSLYVHKTSTRWGYITVANASMGLNGSSAYLTFNPITGGIFAAGTTGTGWTVVTSGATTDSLATGISGNGWLRYFITFTTDTSGTVIASINNNVASSTNISYAGNGTGLLYMWGAMLSLGSLVGYEATTTLARNNPTRYVKYNVAEGLWDYGTLLRTAWLDNSIYGTPLGGDVNYRIQQHEQGFDDDDGPMRDVFAETGYGTVSDGSTIMSVDQVQPDMKWFGNDGGVTITLKAVKYPGGPETQFGPYSVTSTTQFFSTRVRSKQVAVRYDWAPIMGYSARVGATAFRVKPAGTRP